MIGLCIKYFHHNYGGMLQAYATASELERRGLSYELIRYEKKLTPIRAVRSVPRLLNSVLLNDKKEELRKRRGLSQHPEFAAGNALRESAFERFEKAHFTKLSPVFHGYEELRAAGRERYDAVMTGSDQLWSPAGLPTNYYNLMFVPEDVRKISYASSFGVSQIPWYQRSRTAAYLRRIDHISMRENRGAEIVRELTGRTVPVVADPVLMFDEAEWAQLVPVSDALISGKEGEPEEERNGNTGGLYIFAYFLGRNPAYREAVRAAARDLGCRVIALRHMDQYVPEDESFGDFAPYDVGPERFLNLLRGAAYICTDSFHGCCFSVIHGKQVVMFNRYGEESSVSKNSRIDSLCENLGLSARRYRSGESLKDQLTAPMDCDAVRMRLKRLQSESAGYLDNALRGLN